MTGRDTSCILWLVCVYFIPSATSISLQISGGSHRFFIQNFDADDAGQIEPGTQHQKIKRYIMQPKESSQPATNSQEQRSGEDKTVTETSIKQLEEILRQCRQNPVRGSCKDTYVPRIYFADDAHPQTETGGVIPSDEGRSLSDNLIDEEEDTPKEDRQNVKKLNPSPAPIPATFKAPEDQTKIDKQENDLAYPTIFVDQNMISDIIKDPSVEDIIFIRKEVRGRDLEANIKNKCENAAKQLHILKKFRAIHEDIRQKDYGSASKSIGSLTVNSNAAVDAQNRILPPDPIDAGSQVVSGATSGYVIDENSRKIIPVVIENSGVTERIFPLPGFISSEKTDKNLSGTSNANSDTNTQVESLQSTEMSDLIGDFDQSTTVSESDVDRSTESSEDSKIFGPDVIQDTHSTTIPNSSEFSTSEQPEIETSTMRDLDFSSSSDPEILLDSETSPSSDISDSTTVQDETASDSPEIVEKINDFDDSTDDVSAFTAIASLISETTEIDLDTSDTSETLSTAEETSTPISEISEKFLGLDNDYSSTDKVTETSLDETELTTDNQSSDESTTLIESEDERELTETSSSDETSEATLAVELSDNLSTGYTEATDETPVSEVKRLAPDYSYPDTTTNSGFETSTSDPAVSEDYATSDATTDDDKVKLLMTEMTDSAVSSTVEPLTVPAEETENDVSTEIPIDSKVSPLIPIISTTQQPSINGGEPFHEEHNIQKETKIVYEEKVNETFISNKPGSNSGVIVSPIRKGSSDGVISVDQEAPPLSSADQKTDSSTEPKPERDINPIKPDRPDVKKPVNPEPVNKIDQVQPVDPKPGIKIDNADTSKPSGVSKPVDKKPEQKVTPVSPGKPVVQKPAVNKVSPGNQAKPVVTKPGSTSVSNSSEQKQLIDDSSTKLISDTKTPIKFPDLPKIDVDSLENKYTPLNDLRIYINQQNKKQQQSALSQLSDRDLKDKIDHAFHHAEVNIPIDLGSKDRPSSRPGAEIYLHGNAEDFSKIQTMNGAVESLNTGDNSGGVKNKPTSGQKITQKELKSKIELRVPNAIVADGLLNTFFIILLSDNATRSDIENKNKNGTSPEAVEVDDLCVPLYENGTMNDFLSITKLLKGAVYFKNSRAKVPIKIRKGGERKCSSLNAYNIFKEFGDSEGLSNTVAKRRVSDEDLQRVSSRTGTGGNERKLNASATGGNGNSLGNRIQKTVENPSGSSERIWKTPGFASSSGEWRGNGGSTDRKLAVPVDANRSGDRKLNSRYEGFDGWLQGIPLYESQGRNEGYKNGPEYGYGQTGKRVTPRAASGSGSNVIGSTQEKGRIKNDGGPSYTALDVINSVRKQDALFEQFLKMKSRINDELDSFIQKPAVNVKSQQKFVNKNKS